MFAKRDKANDAMTQVYTEEVIALNKKETKNGVKDETARAKLEVMKNDYKLKDEEKLHTVALLLTDIMKEGSEVLVVSDDISIFEKAFNCKLENGKVWLDGCLSRKKQIIPFFEPAFA